MNNSFFNYLILLGFLSILLPTRGQAQVEEFPYQRDWATYMAPISTAQFDNQGAQIFYGFDSYYSYEINPFDSLASYVTNPGYESNYYLGKLNPDQSIAYVKKVGQARSLDTLPRNFFGSLEAVDAAGNIYVSGVTQASQGIATPGSYQSDFSHNYSDSYEVYYPELDVTVTIPPELCADAFIIKYSPAGEKLWGSYYHGNQDMLSINLIEQSGYLYLYGMTTSYEGIATAGTYISEWGDEIPHHNYRPFVLKINENTGAVEWGTYLGTGVVLNTYIGKMFTVNSNGYCFYFGDEGTVILNPEGELYSINNSPPVSYDLISFSKADNLGNIYLSGVTEYNDSIGSSGTFRPSKSFEKQSFILKINQEGEKVWGSYLFNSNLGIASTAGKVGLYIGKSALYLLSVTDEASLATPGVYQEEAIGSQNNLVFFKMNAIDGSLLWLSYYGDPIGEAIMTTPKISLDNKDNLYFSTVSGISSPNSITTEGALFPLPINDKGGFTVKFINEKNLSVDKSEFSGLKLYPNPASNSITLKSEKPFAQDTKFSIYDLQGRKIKELKSDTPQSTQTINISGLSTGVYFLKVQNERRNQSLKFVKKN